jgi:signal transduction histidine kinase
LKIQHQVFDPFFTTKPVGKGTGQGLSLARDIVTAHGGTLTFQSRPDEGTDFFVRLPLSSAD